MRSGGARACGDTSLTYRYSDNCNDIRRKIRQVLKEPGFKVRY